MQVSAWLKLHPAIAEAISWQPVRQRPISYPHWPDNLKAALEAEVLAYAKGKPSKLDDPPANLLQVADGQLIYSRIDPAHAWKLYLSHLACGLWCEIYKKLPWSVTDYSAASLQILFDSRQMFTWRDTPTDYETEFPYIGATLSGYEINIDSCGAVTYAPPADALNFIVNTLLHPNQLRVPSQFPHSLSNQMIVPDQPDARYQMICKLTDWCRNLVHIAGLATGLSTEQYWGYRGWSPVLRVLQGTINPVMDADFTKHYTDGCSGTAGLLRAVLRVINIPVEIRRPAIHAQPWFPTENIGLCHADDLYVRRLRYLPSQVNTTGQIGFVAWSAPFPVTELFITPDQYDQWFAASLSDDQKTANVSRQSLAVDLKWLPYWVLKRYCDDLANGTTEVADYFKLCFTVDQLSAQGLWERLAAKLPSVGGCAALATTDTY